MKKRIILLLITVMLLNVFVVAASAADSTLSQITPRWTNCASVDTSFVIMDGTSEASIKYAGAESMSYATFKVEVQKRFLLVFWNTVDEQTITVYDVRGTEYIYSTLNASGTYRAKFTLTFYGTDGSSDVIEDTKEYSY